MNVRWKIAQAAEIKWWQHYLRNKSAIDYLKWKRQYWLEFLEKTQVQLTPGARVLDAGCGPAGIFMALPGQMVEAVDPLLEAYILKLPHFRPADYTWVKFIPSSIEDFTIHQTYDTVFCLNAINHVARLGRCLDKLAAATKKGGTLVLSVDAHNFSFFKALFRLIPGDILHPHQHNLKEYEKMLSSKGCRISKTILLKKEFFFNYYVIVSKKL